MNFESIKNQLDDLESQGGFIKLPNGTMMEGKELIILFFKMDKIREKYKTNRAPLISDFDSKDQQLIRGLALWEPPFHHGALAVFLAEQSKIILQDSFGISV